MAEKELTATGTVSNRHASLWAEPTRPIVLAGLVLVACLLRLIVVWNTPVITRDGMLYVGYARMMHHGMWLELVSDWFLFNPYPALIAAVAWWGIDYELSGQLLSALASGLAIWPLTLWCRSAFNTQTAWLATLTYLFHPVLLRYSGHVLREGLYWGLLWWGVLCWWNLSRKGGWWRAALCGAITTAALLTRFEGVALYLLGGLWLWQRSPATTSRRWGWWGASVAVFPLTLLILNLLLIPAGQGWHGCGRWANYALKVLTGSDRSLPTTPQITPQHMADVTARERARVADLEAPTDVRALAKSLPAWNALGEPNAEVLRLQRFLILADDQSNYLFVGRMVNQALEALLFPVLFCCGWGWSRSQKAGVWMASRDWPLVAYAGLLLAMLYYNLCTEYILEARYLFCLMPLVLPWSATGACLLWEDLTRLAATAPRWQRWMPRPGVVGGLLIAAALLKLVSGWEGNTKQPQRVIGQRLRQEFSQRLRIAGPENLKRIAHYADADYFIIPRGLADPVQEWLDQQPVDIVVLETEDPSGLEPRKLEASPDHPRYRPLYESEIPTTGIHVFRVQPAIQQVGS